MMVANSHNLIVTVKPANQRNNVGAWASGRLAGLLLLGLLSLTATMTAAI